MWSVVAPFNTESRAPSARAKHTATLVGEHIYLLGGRNGNIPLKDFWKYNLGRKLFNPLVIMVFINVMFSYWRMERIKTKWR